MNVVFEPMFSNIYLILKVLLLLVRLLLRYFLAAT